MAEENGATRDFSYRLSTQDATFIYAESNSGPLHIGSIGLFEGRIDFESILGHLDSRMHLVPRYRQRLAAVPLNLAHAMMEDDPGFDVKNHAFRHDLPAGLSEEAALAEMMTVFRIPLDRSRPLWELHCYHGLEGGRTAVMWKVHHCLVDGVSGVELLKVMYDFRPDPEPVAPPAEPWTPAAPASAPMRLARAARDLYATTVRGTIRAARDAIADPADAALNARMVAVAMAELTRLATRRIAPTPWNGGVVTQRRSLAWSRHPFADFRSVRQAFGGSVNDVVLTMLTEGAARYLARHRYTAPGAELCVGCPVNVRHLSERASLGNRVSMMFPTTPAEPMDVVERLRAIHEETERIKSAGLAQALEVLIRLGDTFPPSMLAAGSRVATTLLDAASTLGNLLDWPPRRGTLALPAIGINFIATNVPGVQVAQFLCGHRCLDMIPLVPLGATLGYGVAILSYNQDLYFGFSAAPRLMPDVGVMKSLVDEAFDELKRRGAQQLSLAGRAMASAGLAGASS
jgi:diacylglycerol O-acyltransferase / wax synthase